MSESDNGKMTPCGLTMDQVHTIQIINLVCASLSILGCCLVFGMYKVYKSYRNYAFKLVVLFTVAEFIFSIASVMSIFTVNSQGTLNWSFGCQVEGFLREYSVVNSVFWFILIAYVSKEQVINLGGSPKQHKISVLFVLSLVISLSFAILPLFSLITDKFGLKYGVMTYTWCEVQPSFFVAIFFYLPVLIGMIITIRYYRQMIRFLKTSPKEQVVDYNKIMRFSFIYCISWIPAILDFLYYHITEKHLYWLLIVHVACSRLQGLLYGILLNSTRVRAIKQTYLQDSILNNRESKGLMANYSFTSSELTMS